MKYKALALDLDGTLTNREKKVPAGNKAVSYTHLFTFKNKVVNAKSVISILASGVGCGDEITLIAEGPDEEEALKAVSESFRKALQD